MCSGGRGFGGIGCKCAELGCLARHEDQRAAVLVQAEKSGHSRPQSVVAHRGGWAGGRRGALAKRVKVDLCRAALFFILFYFFADISLSSLVHAGQVIRTSATASAAAGAHAGEVAAKGHFSRHWYFERGLAVALLTLIPAAVFVPSAPVDYAIGVVVPIHAYLGFEVPSHVLCVLVLPCPFFFFYLCSR